MEIEIRLMNLEEVLRAVERYVAARTLRLGQGVEPSIHVEPNLPQIRGDEVLLMWALENITQNALDAVAGRGRAITIRAFPGETGSVTLHIHDTGPGVDLEIRDRLFEPGATTKSGGWGVGLPLTRRIMERIHGGKIKLARSGPRGSTFRLRLPAFPSYSGQI